MAIYAYIYLSLYLYAVINAANDNDAYKVTTALIGLLMATPLIGRVAGWF